MNDVVQFIYCNGSHHSGGYAHCVYAYVHCALCAQPVSFAFSFTQCVCECVRLAFVLKTFRCYLATCDSVCLAMNK